MWLISKMAATNIVDFKVVYLFMITNPLYDLVKLSQDILMRFLYGNQSNRPNNHTECRQKGSKEPVEHRGPIQSLLPFYVSYISYFGTDAPP